MWTVILLLISNTFMTMAWYGHLRNHAEKPLLATILLSWAIAFLEYCFMVPANRLGYDRYGLTLTQLKIMQECITLTVFLTYAYIVFHEKIRWNTAVSMVLVVLAVMFAFIGRNEPAAVQPTPHTAQAVHAGAEEEGIPVPEHGS
jgi:hypothetical protein